MRIRRATRYEPPVSHAESCPVVSSASSAWTQTWSSTSWGCSALMFAVPSLNPKRLRGVTCWVDVDEVRPYPSWLHRTEARPNPMRARLRIAWTAT